MEGGSGGEASLHQVQHWHHAYSRQTHKQSKNGCGHTKGYQRETGLPEESHCKNCTADGQWQEHDDVISLNTVRIILF